MSPGHPFGPLVGEKHDSAPHPRHWRQLYIKRPPVSVTIRMAIPFPLNGRGVSGKLPPSGRRRRVGGGDQRPLSESGGTFATIEKDNGNLGSAVKALWNSRALEPERHQAPDLELIPS